MPILQQNLHLPLWQVQNWKITNQLFPKKYTYAFIEISPKSKVWWLLRSSWKHELKLSHNSSDTRGDALRTDVKIMKWNESFSRQRLSQSFLFESLKIKRKDKKIARARRASAICSLKKSQVLISTNCRGNHVITCYNVHEKTLQKVKTDEILRVCANYSYFGLVLQLCACVMTLHSFYMRMHSFSANQRRIIFLMYIINKVIYL